MSRRELVIATWAVVGVGLLLLECIVRLGARAVALVRAGLDGPMWLVLALVVAVFTYGEGYRALQRHFAPKVVARALDAGACLSGCLPVLAAPLYAMSLIGTEGRTLARAWGGVALIVLAALAVRALPAPWRGIVDAGVVSALTWGLIAIAVQFRQALRARLPGRLRSSSRAFAPHPPRG